jgi:hypoxanthine-DNA glycosylase
MKKSLPPVVDSNTRAIVLGTMPGEQSLLLQQYYSNPSNQFWRLMSAVLSANVPEDYNSRVSFLLHYGIGLWDVLESCERNGSSDSAIREERPNKLTPLLNAFPSIRCVAFNGGKASECFRRSSEELPGEIEQLFLPSSSGAPGKYVKPLKAKINDWKILRQVVGKGSPKG